MWHSDLAFVDVVTIAIQDSAGDLVPSLPYDFRASSRQLAPARDVRGAVGPQAGRGVMVTALSAA